MEQKRDFNLRGNVYSLRISSSDEPWGKVVRLILEETNENEVGRVQFCAHPESIDFEFWQSKSYEELFDVAVRKFSTWVAADNNLELLDPGWARFRDFNG